MRVGEIDRDRRLTVLEINRGKAAVACCVTMIVGAVSAVWSRSTALRALRA
jgi:hypothetical protein